MNTHSLLSPPLPRAGQQRAWWQQPASASAQALALIGAAQQHSGLLLVVVRDTHGAHTLEQDLRVFAGDLPVLHFPDWETLPYDQFSPHPDIISQRIAALYRLPSVARGVLVVPASTLMQRLPPTRFIGGNALMVRKGQRLDMDAEKRRLEAAGYRNVGQVLDPGDFAVRGALLDIYAMGADAPYRIELFDDEVESIRSFDPESQRSQHPVEEVSLLPAREFPLDDAACNAVRRRLSERFDIDPRRCPLYQDLKQGGTPAGIEYYLPLFFDEGSTQTLFDYLGDNTLAVIASDAFDAADGFWAQTAERYEQRRHDLERPVLPPDELYLAPDALRTRLNAMARIEWCPSGHPRHAEAHRLGEQPAPNLPLAQKGEPAAALKSFLGNYPGRVLLATDSAGRREALLELLDADGIKPATVADWHAFLADTNSRWAITVAALDDGFALTEPVLTVLTERQLYPERAAQPRRRKRAGRDPDSIIRDLTQIAIGAPIVHEDHGVGRYQGLATLDAGGQTAEFLEILYAKGDKLYVPVAQLHLVSRYSGATPELAPLHALGGEAWEKAKRRAAEKVRDVAAELLEIQARRQARKGLALTLDRAMYEPFAAGFPFEETPDQLAAIEAVIADLDRPTPMDRVVCGDVGFGKTEVAVRAAFVAANAGKQVAVLVPTTLLAEQHYRNFRDRFADWPIRVEVLSRFKSPKETRAALIQLASGGIDVVVGTHKLLQNDVKFHDLGLVIVDEEQRFGVRQKERLKALRAEVHLLTLTATPIPRTLNMAMSGLRELSLIATAPAHRLAVKTFIAPWDSAVLREAFARELARGGQVYFLHNEVSSIERMARELGELVPDARIRVAHGQMPERELEATMLDFHRQRFNVLVCTTIIESGIDIPSANTIIINRADRFGLAQLHQLRGRVGRSHHRAYAYLLVPADRKAMTGDAEKRLEALANLDELGAGFTLATHDLEIRGAGELLGEEQSGQIAEIGFSLYSELLERAVRSLKQGKIPDLDASHSHGAQIELHIAALIPDDYLPDVHTRLTLYKRIASARDSEALRELQVEMIDRFGLLPEPAKNLFAVAELKLGATELGIRKLDLGERGGRIEFDSQPNVDPMSVIRLIQSQPRHYRMDGPEKLRITLELPGASERLRCCRGLLLALQKAD
ncbi:MAG: transcription-repair coupling factor [Xanthomonadaceae bacterium]|nr:transcription-repair coupling factor [Xanthomonadaceae bacterium]MDP2183983.1 transcription-repair coupling factor [Xanthomonadales bacterium]MDZ4116550.1 transcription-repair coupling factor [Xanthomonadaceae bacterium]MDZ4376770.1 transcription-repair coupling factor [Xanthomonadaceae bacterium]